MTSSSGAPAGSTAHGVPPELFLMRLRFKEGRLIQVGGNKPFVLDDPKMAWVVYAGRVDLFAVRLGADRPTGPRHFLVSLSAGQALYGMALPPADGSVGLLAVGIAGTRLIRIPRARLLALVSDPMDAHAALELLNGWVTELSRVAVRTRPPKECGRIEPEGEITLRPLAAVRAAQGVVWVRHVQGGSIWMGETGLPVATSDGFFPLAIESWLQADQAACMVGVDTPRWVALDESGLGLDRFHALFLETVAAGLAERARQESAQLLRKIGVDQRALSAGIARLAGVMDTRSAQAIHAADDPILAACRRVALAQGMVLCAAAPSVDTQDPGERIAAIARASRARVRQVTLRGEWWNDASGPLVAFRRSNGHAVALLPAGASRYVLEDPGQATRTRVTSDVAANLTPTGYMFYAPFPDGAVGLRTLLAFGLRGAGPDWNMLLAMSAVAGLLGLTTPVLAGILVDSVFPNARFESWLTITLALVAISIATALFAATRGIALLRLSGQMDCKLQAALWDRLLNLPPPFFRRYTAGDLATRALGIDQIRQVLTGSALDVLLSGLFSLASLGLLFYYSLPLALVATLLVSAIIGGMAVASVARLRLQRRVVQQQGRIAGLILQLLTGIAKLRVANAEGRAFAVWAAEFAEQKRTAFSARSIANGVATLDAVAPLATAMGVLALLANLPRGSLSTGAFVAFTVALGQFLGAMTILSTTLVGALAIIPIFERLKPILTTPVEVDAATPAPGELSGAIEISGVSFRYAPDGPLVLDTVSMHAAPGEFVAVVGLSGSGKSTLFRMLLGFEKPEAGAVYYDGRDLIGTDVQAVRRQIGVVLQNARVMAGDILTNIIGATNATIDDAWQAASRVGLEEEIRAMPMGMYTPVIEGGGNLSGGQCQRLLIARAIIGKPRILLFDEATSALDNQTQETVRASIQALQATRLVIAHRLSTIVSADRIYVMDGGRIVQTGTFAELMAQAGPLAELAKRQLA